MLAGIVEVYYTEMLLGRARLQQQEKNGTSSSSYYRLARGSLRRARTLLLKSRRNVIWWRLYILIVSQYYADTLYSYTLLSDKPAINLAEVVAVLRKGLVAIRRSADYYAKWDGEPNTAPRWLVRMNHELQLSALVIAKKFESADPSNFITTLANFAGLQDKNFSHKSLMTVRLELDNSEDLRNIADTRAGECVGTASDERRPARGTEH